MSLRLHLSAVLVAAAAALCVPATAPAVTVGIADQKADMFSDPLFQKLGVRHARIAVSWDALHHDWQRTELDVWLEAARARGIEPLIGFMHARGDRRRVLPSPRRLALEFTRFRARYPWVRNYAAWNEANHCGEPTCRKPKLVASYYRGMRSACGSCRILASELLDMPNMASWVKRFVRAVGHQPRYWGLHNYVDANRFRTSGTRRLLALTTGRIWFTETGGIVARKTVRKVSFDESPQHAAQATSWVFSRLARLSPRIQRIYLYHWNASETFETWDSALIAADGTPRPAFRVLRHALGAISLRARRAGR
jgi:hypothetical protein